MKRNLNRLQWYSSIISSILVFALYIIGCYAFTRMDLLEMLIVGICFVIPVVASIPFYLTED